MDFIVKIKEAMEMLQEACKMNEEWANCSDCPLQIIVVHLRKLDLELQMKILFQNNMGKYTNWQSKQSQKLCSVGSNPTLPTKIKFEKLINYCYNIYVR